MPEPKQWTHTPGKLDTRSFGTMENPLRASALTQLCCCPGFLLLKRVYDDPGGPAAHTGTAVGYMIELFHNGQEISDAINRARGAAEEGVDNNGRPFDRARWDQAEYWFRRYVDDERNPRDVVLADTQETELELQLDPAPEDPTGEPVVIRGHPDQIRISANGDWQLWDIKSGSPAGLELLYNHAWQLAFYTLAAAAKYNRTVHVGGVIRLRGYDQKRDPGDCDVFYYAPWKVDHCWEMLDNVVQHVAWIRSGLIHTHPGRYCQYCPADGPGNCGEMLGDDLI